jgi:hypothetical protein
MNVCKFSQDRKYRYRLDFDVDPPLGPKGVGRIVWILLNPSTADENNLDPTLRRVRNYARAWQYRTVTILNLFAWRATQPSALLEVPDPVGPDNDREIVAAIIDADRVVLGWGAVYPRLRPRAREVEELLENADVLGDAMAIGTTKSGEPRHPLYMPAAAELEDYLPWARWVARGDVEPNPRR